MIPPLSPMGTGSGAGESTSTVNPGGPWKRTTCTSGPSSGAAGGATAASLEASTGPEIAIPGGAGWTDWCRGRDAGEAVIPRFPAVAACSGPGRPRRPGRSRLRSQTAVRPRGPKCMRAEPGCNFQYGGSSRHSLTRTRSRFGARPNGKTPGEPCSCHVFAGVLWQALAHSPRLESRPAAKERLRGVVFSVLTRRRRCGCLHRGRLGHGCQGRCGDGRVGGTGVG